MNWDWIPTLIGALSGIGGAYLTFRVQSRKQKVTADTLIFSKYETYIAKLEGEINSLMEKNKSLEEMIQKHTTEITRLQWKIQLMDTVQNDLPFPAWLKDTDGVMLALNKSYEDIILQPMGKTASDYIGKTDFDIWPKDVAQKFKEEDSKVLQSKKALTFKESINIGGVILNMITIKYVKFASGHTVTVGTAGISIPEP